MNEQSREQQLVSAARDGDMDAFEALVHLYEKRVFALTCLLYTSDAADE